MTSRLTEVIGDKAKDAITLMELILCFLMRFLFLLLFLLCICFEEERVETAIIIYALVNHIIIQYAITLTLLIEGEQF